MGTVVLVRHGESTWNREGRVQGWAPTRLTDRGREQARRVGAHIAGEYDVDRLVCSDLGRARETARLVTESGVPVEPTGERAWRERDFGVYQGLTREAILNRRPRARRLGSVTALDDVDGGESRAAFQTRVAHGFARLHRSLADGTVVVITHGGPIRLLLGYAKGLTPVDAFASLAPENCGVTELEVGDGLAVRRENDRV